MTTGEKAKGANEARGEAMALKHTKLGSSFQLAIGKFFSFLPLTPNQITLLSLLPALLAFFLAYRGMPLESLALFALAGATDALDGAIARARKQVSARGAYIDGMVDRLVEFLLVLSFFFYALPDFILPTGMALIIILFFGSAMTSFATAYAEHRHVADAKKIARQPGMLPRAERLLLLFAALAFVPFSPAASSFILFSEAALCMVTFFQRFLFFSSQN